MRRSTDPRADYVAIATRQFAEHGFHGVSLAALAKDAGVSKQALLHFFGTKERLYGDVLAALADRLVRQIDETATDTPAAHLRAYFAQMLHATLAEPIDARLVIRALLDSDGRGQRWPLKPYLDRLVGLTRAAARDEMSDAEALAWAYQIIGALQYMVVSSETVTAIYGTGTYETLARDMERFCARAVQDLCAPE